MNMAAEAVTTNNSPSMQYIEICAQDDLIENIGQCALVQGKQIALFRLSDCEQIYALGNYDPFSEANVLSRGVVGDLNGQPVVASPIYKQHFNLATGVCLEDETVVLETYPVRITDGRVAVGIVAQ